MFKGLGNIATLLKHAKNIGGQMENLNEELKNKRVAGTAGGGMVTVHANGLGHVLRVEIDQTLKDKNDLEMVIDLLPAAINDATGKSKELHVQAMQSMTGGFSLPGAMDDALRQFAGHYTASAEIELSDEIQIDEPPASGGGNG